jgi:undecaprenyl-diphosphatase
LALIHKTNRAIIARRIDDPEGFGLVNGTDTTLRTALDHIHAFVRRGFSPADPFGLHLALGVFLSVGSLGVFWTIADHISGETPLTRLDRLLADRLHAHARETPLAVSFFQAVTALGSQPVLTALAVAGVLVLSRRGHRPLAWTWLLVVMGGLFHVQLKQIFQRSRPEFADPFVTELSWGFPSGHAMGALIGYGLLAYLMLLLPRPRARVVAVVLLAALILAIGFSRLYLGVHYLSDVLGGFAAGMVWLAAWISLIEAVRRRSRRQAASGQAQSVWVSAE